MAPSILPTETMPLYEYECNDCEHRFERIQKFSDPLVSTCPVCGGEVRKLLSSPAIQFKGTGWYVTDYAKKSSGDAQDGARKDGEGKAAGDAKGDGKKSTDGKATAASTSKDTSSSTSGSGSTTSPAKSSGTAAAR